MKTGRGMQKETGMERKRMKKGRGMQKDRGTRKKTGRGMQKESGTEREKENEDGERAAER